MARKFWWSMRNKQSARAPSRSAAISATELKSLRALIQPNRWWRTRPMRYGTALKSKSRRSPPKVPINKSTQNQRRKNHEHTAAVALGTGAARGIGAAIAERLAADGAAVAEDQALN